MTAQPDHATEAADYLAIAEQLATIAQRLPSRPVVNDLRAEVQPPAHPGGYVPEPEPVVVSEPEIAIRGGRLTASVADELRAQVANMHRPAPDCGKGFIECIQELEAERQTDQTGSDEGYYHQGHADGWNGALDAIRSALLAHGYTASD